MVHGFVGRAFLDVLKSSTAAPPRYEREKMLDRVRSTASSLVSYIYLGPYFNDQVSRIQKPAAAASGPGPGAPRFLPAAP